MAAPSIRSTKNSPTRDRQYPSWIQKGVVYDVDLKNYTVSVVSEYGGKRFDHIQVASPYIHPNNGEGIYVMPEIGAICWVCQPSDEDTPFLLAFIGSFELENAKQDNLEDRAGEAGVESEELDIPTPQSTASTAVSKKNSANASARCGRPFINSGDIVLRTRDENYIAIKRGGVVQISATSICQTVYIPIKNYIRHFCENYEINTPGGMELWSIQRQEEDPSGDTPSVYRITVRDKAQNDKADIQVRMGHVSDSIRYEIEVAPKGIDVTNGEASGTKFKLTIDKDGNHVAAISGSKSETIGGNRSSKISGSDTVTVGGDRAVSAKNETTTVTEHVLKAANSKEEIVGIKSIKASIVNLGNTATYSAVLGELLVIWLTKHVHPMWNVPDVQVPELPNILSKTIKVGP